MADPARRLQAARGESARLVRLRAAFGLSLFVLVFAVSVFAIETLWRVGVPGTILAWLTAAFALVVPACAAVAARTVSPTVFATAARQLSAAENTMAAAVALCGGAFAAGLAASFVRDGGEAAALLLGLCGGCLLGGALFAPYLRRSGCPSVGDLLAARFGGTACFLAGAVVSAALMAMLVAELNVAARFAGWVLGTRTSAALAAAAVLMLAPALLGGVRGLTIAGILQFVIALTAIVLASAWVSESGSGSMLAAAGYATAASGLAAEARGVAATPPWELFGTSLCVAMGISVAPAVLLRSVATRSTRVSRSSGAWTLLFVAVMTTGVASMAAVATWTAHRQAAAAGSALDLLGAEPWIGEWSAKAGEPVTLCGRPVTDVMNACGFGPLKPGDLGIDPDAVLLAAPAIIGAPLPVTVLLGAGLLAAAVAAGSLLLFGIGRAFANDMLFRPWTRRAPASLRLLVERATMVAAAAAAARLAADPPAGYLTLVLAALSLAASALFPALLAGIWWRRSNGIGALSGMAAGTALAGYLIACDLIDPRSFDRLGPALADWARFLGAERAALLAVPAGLAVTILVSVATPRPRPAERAFADALMSPHDLAADG